MAQQVEVSTDLTASAPSPRTPAASGADRFAGWLGKLRGVFPFAVLLAVWWIAWAVFNPSELILVSPPRVLDALGKLLREGELLAYIEQSLGRLFGPRVLFAMGLGLITGWLLGLNRDLAAASEPLLRFLNAVSGIAWLPLLILWFGFTETTITAIIVYTMSFPIIFNAMIGVRTVPERLTDATRSLGAGRLRLFRDVYIPGSLPSVITGVRLGIGFGWRALIAGEFVIGGGGLGFLIFNARTVGNIAEVMAGMIVLGTLWLALDRLILRPVETYTSERWGMVRI